MIRFLFLLGLTVSGVLAGALIGFACAVVFNPLASQLFTIWGGLAGGLFGFLMGKFIPALIGLFFRIILGAALGGGLGWAVTLVWREAPVAFPAWCAVAGAVILLLKSKRAVGSDPS